jgi:hypothetical protein
MKSLLVVLCVLCLSLTAMAETPISLGGQFGLAFTGLSVSPSNTSFSSRTTFGVGGVLEVGFSQLFWLQPELLYTSGGAKNTQNVNGTSVTINYNYNWIELSPLIKIKFGKKDFKPYIIAGPKIGILTGANYDWTGGGQGGSGDSKDNSESLNLSIDFGAGTDFYLDQQTCLYGDIRYSLGLTNINKDPQAAGTSVKTSAFMIVVGAKFRVD